MAQSRSDGEILESKTRASLPPYATLDDFSRNYFPQTVYDEAMAQIEFDILDIQYSSGGLSVPGVLVRPKNLAGRRWPAIVYNRGGTGDYGRIDHSTIVDLYLWAKAGFVVIASDYRFHGDTAKRDEWGGADLDDVMNVVAAARSLDFVDRERLFMLGLSRGGTMTYRHSGVRDRLDMALAGAIVGAFGGEKRQSGRANPRRVTAALV